MASQVFSGSSNFSYTNNTGQNVRIVINYMQCPSSSETLFKMTWGGSSSSTQGGASAGTGKVLIAIGRNLAFGNSFYSSATTSSAPTALNSGTGVSETVAIAGNNALVNTDQIESGVGINAALPTEIMIAAGQTFSATCGNYNVVVIPEAG